MTRDVRKLIKHGVGIQATQGYNQDCVQGIESGLQVTVNTGSELPLKKFYIQPQFNAANAQALNVNYSIDGLGFS